MNEMDALFKRQEAWQRALKDLPWPEKLRMAARVRDAVARLRRTGPSQPPAASTPPHGMTKES